MKCEYNDCQNEAKFDLYELKENFTKKWIHVCDFHDKLVAISNVHLSRDNPDKRFVDITKK